MQMNLKVVCRGKDESCFIFKSLVEFLLEPLKYDFKDYVMEAYFCLHISFGDNA